MSSTPPESYNGVPSIAYARLSTATSGFAARALIGSGVSGDVYRGDLDGVPIAVKRLRLPDKASPEMRDELMRRFVAEMDVLSAYNI